MRSVDFEVSGKVQGVFFRKHTVKEAKRLRLTGYVKNTSRGTVIGTAQGSEEAVKAMKRWLQNVGSPKSRIDKCEFRNERTISALHYDDFVLEH